MQNRVSTAKDAAEVRAQQMDHQAALKAQIEEKKRMQVLTSHPEVWTLETLKRISTTCARQELSQNQ